MAAKVDEANRRADALAMMAVDAETENRSLKKRLGRAHRAIRRLRSGEATVATVLAELGEEV